MKKYMNFEENGSLRREAVQQTLDELKLFQFLLRNAEELNARFDGKAEEIAAGLEPWIAALENIVQD